MIYWSDGWGAAAGVAMLVAMLVVAAIAGGGLFMLLRPIWGRPKPGLTQAEYAESHRGRRTTRSNSEGWLELDLLDRRYARGEIEREEYLQRRRDLVDRRYGHD